MEKGRTGAEKDKDTEREKERERDGDALSTSPPQNNLLASGGTKLSSRTIPLFSFPPYRYGKEDYPSSSHYLQDRQRRWRSCWEGGRNP